MCFKIKWSPSSDLCLLLTSALISTDMFSALAWSIKWIALLLEMSECSHKMSSLASDGETLVKRIGEVDFMQVTDYRLIISWQQNCRKETGLSIYVN